MIEELTEAEYTIADRIERKLEMSPEGVTPSMAARAARTDTGTAAKVLGWMCVNRYAHAAPRGAWTRYFIGRAA